MMNRVASPTHVSRSAGIEDHQLSLVLLKQLLKPYGYETLEASEGLQAIGLAREKQPDLILMDLRLPDISGLEVTRLLKQDDRMA